MTSAGIAPTSRGKRRELLVLFGFHAESVPGGERGATRLERPLCGARPGGRAGRAFTQRTGAPRHPPQAHAARGAPPSRALGPAAVKLPVRHTWVVLVGSVDVAWGSERQIVVCSELCRGSPSSMRQVVY